MAPWMVNLAGRARARGPPGLPFGTIAPTSRFGGRFSREAMDVRVRATAVARQRSCFWKPRPVGERPRALVGVLEGIVMTRASCMRADSLSATDETTSWATPIGTRSVYVVAIVFSFGPSR